MRERGLRLSDLPIWAKGQRKSLLQHSMSLAHCFRSSKFLQCLRAIRIPSGRDSRCIIKMSGYLFEQILLPPIRQFFLI